MHSLTATERVMGYGSRSKFAKPLTVAAMSLGYGVAQLDVTIVNTALNSIGTALGGGVVILTAGALGDRLGGTCLLRVSPFSLRHRWAAPWRRRPAS